LEILEGGEVINLIGKNVEVMALDVIYRGRLAEIAETEVHIETELGWVVIPVSHIAFVREEVEQ
jgi:hypothetical protein